MNLEKWKLIKQIFFLIEKSPGMTIPELKAKMKVPVSKPPKTQELNVYRIIKELNELGFLLKEGVDIILPGGPQYVLKTTKMGKKEMSELFNVNIGKDISIKTNLEGNWEEIEERLSKKINDVIKKRRDDACGEYIDSETLKKLREQLINDYLDDLNELINHLE